MALGWPDLDNLAIVCQFCNGGKLIYRAPLEPVSVAVAASLSAFLDADVHSLPRQIGVVAAIREADKKCGVCGLTTDRTELTVRPPDEACAHKAWFVPWVLEVECYECRALNE